MADYSWADYDLPQYVQDDLTVDFYTPSISTSMSTGYDKRRRRFTGQYVTYSVSMLMTLSQLDIFESLFNNELGYGVVAIDFPDPLYLEDTIEVKVYADSSTEPYTITPYGDKDGERVLVSFDLERLVESYTTVTSDTWPSSIPQCPLEDGYSCSTQSGTIRDSDKDAGFISTRRRFTAVIRTHEVSFAMNTTELSTFLNFYYSTGYGSTAFTAPYPFDFESKTMRTRFNSGEGFSVSYLNDVDTFTVSCTWEELPYLEGYS